MINHFYTLHALAREWAPALVGSRLGDAFSQQRGELTLALGTADAEWMLRISTLPPFYFIFRSEGYSKARRNVATLFEDAAGREVTAVRTAERDRMVFLDLDDGTAFQIVLFGARANVFWVDPEGAIREAFQDDEKLRGTAAPTPRPAPRVETFAAFEDRWRPDRKTTAQALAATLPLFDRTLAAEALHRAGLAEQPPGNLSEADRRALFEAARTLQQAFKDPRPRIYWRDRFAETFALTALHHLDDLREEAFETVDEAARIFVRRKLAQARFEELYAPLEKALARAADDLRRRTDRMLDELARPSRADRYERWGHLLMASPNEVPPRAEEIALPDLFGDGEAVTIPLDPSKSAVENAQRFYDKARRTRQAREHAEARLVETEAQAEAAADLLGRLRALESYKDVERFKKDEAAALARFVSEQAGGGDRLPFRRFDVGEGYEVWVGKNARQNDALTFRHAQKHDLWMHARGVAGSHAVLRLPSRQAQPGPHILERAAGIAAYFSKAQGSSLVPVIVVPRKYVRKPRGAAPGAVLVEREEVLLVPPRLPE